MVRTYQAVYEEVYTVDVQGAGNKILVALPWRSGLAKENVIMRSRELNRRLSLRSDLADIVDRGLKRAGADGTMGRILTDADAPDSTRAMPVSPPARR